MTRKEGDREMMTRKEAAAFWNLCFHGSSAGTFRSKKRAWHVGKEEVRWFLDMLYGGPPQCEDEEIMSTEKALMLGQKRKKAEKSS